MKAYRLERPGSIEGLDLVETAAPPCGSEQVLIRVRAVSINNRDLMVVNDQYGFPIQAGLIPLSDAAGEVVAVGAGVYRFAVGDRVSPTMQSGWIGGPAQPEYFGTDLGGSLPGVFAQYIVAPQEAVVRLPDHLTLEEGASLNCAGVTAWVALHTPLPMGAGDTVLVQGTGGVALFALQFAKAMGARVIATTSTEAKAARLRALGADNVINYATDGDWGQRARALTNGRGVDRVIEIGGANTIPDSIGALRIGGQMSLVGASGGIGPGIDIVAAMIGRAIRIETISVGSRNDYEAMIRAIALHRLHPVIDRVFPFAEARAALDWLIARRHVGKIVIRVE